MPMSEHICAVLRQQARNHDRFSQSMGYAMDYMDKVDSREVFPSPDSIAAAASFREALPALPADPAEILEKLHRYGSPATVAQTGGRYFGFVNGGAVPAALAAKWLADVWDQNCALYVISPIVSILEEVCEGWLQDLFGLPTDTAAGFVGGSSTAALCGLAAGRNHLLGNLGYDVSAKGLFGAPEFQVVLGEGAHSTVFKALSILGLGSERVIKVPMNDQGGIREDLVPELNDRTLLILQAGNVNSGAFDSFEPLCRAARSAGAWTHIDGAFGLWAAAGERCRTLTKGIELADSWSVDAHKTLNAPYDNGVVLCRSREALTSALHMTGSYIVYSENRDGMLYTPDMSRRARVVELWATLKSLGRQGVSELVDDLHDKAVLFARLLSENGFSILNDVVFNQILVVCENARVTSDTLKNIQASGELWCGGAVWKNEPVIRISVCSYRTATADIERCVKAFVSAREHARREV